MGLGSSRVASGNPAFLFLTPSGNKDLFSSPKPLKLPKILEILDIRH
jgi:hypothetical protein